jgi:hypothetical protein
MMMAGPIESKKKRRKLFSHHDGGEWRRWILEDCTF